MVRFMAVGIALLLLLAGCRSFPLSTDVDLLERTDFEREGSVHVTIEEGDVDAFDQRRPDDDGACLSLKGDGWRPTVHAAQLRYDVTLRYDGPELDGRAAARAYVAATLEDLWTGDAQLGPEFAVDVAETSTRFEGTVDLRPRQVEALREQAVCWGAELEGHDLRAFGSGEAELSYELDAFELTVRYGLF